MEQEKKTCKAPAGYKEQCLDRGGCLLWWEYMVNGNDEVTPVMLRSFGCPEELIVDIEMGEEGMRRRPGWRSGGGQGDG